MPSPISSASGYSFPAGSSTNLGFSVVDLTDGTWTLTDPDSLVDTVAHDAATGFTTVTWNVLAAGSQDYNPGNGATIRAPRWHKLLLAGGTQVTSDDLVLYQTRMENDETVDDFHQSICCAICIDPTSVTATTIDGLGGNYNANTASNPGYGVWTTNAVSSGANAGAVYGDATMYSGGRHQGGGVYLVLDTNGLRVQSGSRNGSETWAAATNLSEMVLFGTRGIVTIAAGNQSQIRISRRVSTMVAPS